jgi:hypothetical protein
LGNTNHGSDDQRNDDCAVLNIVPGPERVVPMIEQFGDMAPDAKRKNQSHAELEKAMPHFRLDAIVAWKG